MVSWETELQWIFSGSLATGWLIIREDDGLIYENNAQASSLSMQELQYEIYKQNLNGMVIVVWSITADQITAATIMVNEILSGTFIGEKSLLLPSRAATVKLGLSPSGTV